MSPLDWQLDSLVEKGHVLNLFLCESYFSNLRNACFGTPNRLSEFSSFEFQVHPSIHGFSARAVSECFDGSK